MGVVCNLGKSTAVLMNTCASDSVKIQCHLRLEPSVQLHNLSEHTGIKFKGLFRDFELISNDKFSNKGKHARPTKTY